MLQYPSIGARAAEQIYNAIVGAAVDADDQQGVVKAVLDPYTPNGSSQHVSFVTTKDVYETDPERSHVNYVALDSGWEAEFARVLEAHPEVLSYVKNQGMNFGVPYRDGTVAREYRPDFIVQLKPSFESSEPLKLVLEVKGYRGESVKLKSETVRTQWIPGVNNLHEYGHWTFAEFGDVFEMEKEFAALVEKVLAEQKREIA